MTYGFRTIATLVAAVAAMLQAPSLLAQTAPERSLRLGICIAEEHPLGQGSIKFSQIMDKLSGGKTKVKLYPACQLGSETQQIAAVRGGVQDLTIVSSAPVATIIKEFMLFDLPFLFQTEKETDTVLDGKLGQHMLDLAQSKGMIGLCYWENGFRQLTNSKRPVATMDDMVGLKVRVMQNPVYLDTFKAMGANAIPMPMPELYSALETKAMDAQENPIANIHANKMHEVQKYLSLTNHAYAPYVVLISKALWEKMDSKERDNMRTGCNEARDYQRKLIRTLSADLLQDLKAKGMTVTAVSDAEMARMRERTKPVVDKFIQEIGKDIVAQAQQEIAAVRKNGN
ncbi:TRAP transporter substrate-binding protein [Propionivibrio soli]|uniref:TRAP transporter substrate-binding protein n=1 Tax=Propionivibrio soli TaxID=2976531 RepID=UPI0021E811EF|nr:TRAP transporter substrate-binding protein [Propionivibrio soli]